jgi:DNA-binding IclR family transcriptional regulator
LAVEVGDWSRFNARSIGAFLGLTPGEASSGELLESVSQARLRGYAIEIGENEPDVACIGTAIMRGPAAVAALSITAPAVRMTEYQQQQFAGLIAREIPPYLPDGLSLPHALTSKHP